MTIQSFVETLLSAVDRAFEGEANNLLNEARQFGQKTSYIAGRMDGMSEVVKRIQETYASFVKSDQEDHEEEKSLY